MTSTSGRRHNRAPLKVDVLYQCNDYVLKGRIENISSGGILIENIPLFPECDSFPLVFKLPHYVLFESLGNHYLKLLKASEVDGSVIQLQAKMVRQYEDQSGVDKVFIKGIGLEFISFSTEAISLIEKYIKICEKNMLFLLGQFESEKVNEKLIKTLGTYLGYDFNDDLQTLRGKLLHEYQSLKN